MSGHEIRVGAQSGPVINGNAVSSFWATCQCGWTHRGSYSTRDEAQAIGDAHVRAQNEVAA
jgi:hypothetical protein